VSALGRLLGWAVADLAGPLTESEMAYLRERHHGRLERRAGPADRRGAASEATEERRPLVGRAHAFVDRRRDGRRDEGD
jgi:hypothetical protein